MPENKKSIFQSVKKLILFGANGIINTVVTYSLFVVISNIIDYQITIVLVYIFGIFLSYVLNKKFVFRIRGKLYLFVLIYLGMLLANLGITTILVEEFNLLKEIAQLIAISIVFLIGFSLINRFAFPKNTTKNE